ncbi:hypothetical protein PFICI_00115 [Pestalotiopsis fici W106-1]|uniref:non-specific serine/threonine protein kinase n=1 Tax=Pestalotiopsis fici (strain W106-1 / CGMCC3.15140) TaxID=1229662 RepID=W3XLF8_PESFW|nr:uncharacterized protein PFICI_00115 [Pestalotiopsis fici W106-1]ETS86287.1 hypothetical protein PFICI_00115 [Pestalotiopsis fici W106-1]
MSSIGETASRYSPGRRFTRNAELPGGHQHSLGLIPLVERPSIWRTALSKKYKQVRKRISLPTLKVTLPGGAEETKAKSETLDTIEETQANLETKYGTRWKTIGRGAYGTVSVFRKIDIGSHEQKLFAVKEFHRRPRQQFASYRDRIVAEFSLVSSLQHANVIQILDLFYTGQDNFYEVMEYCAGGDMFSLVQSAGNLEAEEADCFLKQLMRGVKYLHEIDVAHCDLKPENLLLTPEGNLKITDFGFCHYMAPSKDGGVELLSGMRGSLPYIAPEEHTDDQFDPRVSDIWACGVIYMFMRVSRYLWLSAQTDDKLYTTYVKDRRVEKGYAPIESLENTPCQNVVYSMLDPVPSRRLTASQFLRSEWGYAIQVCKSCDV